MELRSLKFAVTLAEELHFGRAAERHFVSAQPFGRTIAALEREIGTPLFNRTTRRVELTPAGDKFVSRAEQVLVDVEELVRSVRSAADVESDHLVLGVFGVGLGERGPDVMTTFQRACPGVFMEVLELGFSDMDCALRRRDADVTIVHYTGDVEDVSSTPVLNDRRAMVVPLDSEWTDVERITAAHLGDMPRPLPLPYASASQAAWSDLPTDERPWPGIRTPAVIAAAVANTGRPSLHAMAGQTYYPHPRARYVPCEGSPLQLAVSIRADETRPAVHHFVQVTRAVADLTPR